jgi:translation initiation factor IF-3
VRALKISREALKRKIYTCEADEVILVLVEPCTRLDVSAIIFYFRYKSEKKKLKKERKKKKLREEQIPSLCVILV